ncbi:MAG: cation:proton antiporter [Betaproteobacteria bacterium]|nr:cation:proton antiporter [Betaproteobacteria bacterium]
MRWSRSAFSPIFLVIIGWRRRLKRRVERDRSRPELFLLLFIPPLLFADARALPHRDFMRVLRPVPSCLALGPVVLTVVAVGYFMHWPIPSMPLAVAFTLGASHADRRGGDRGDDGKPALPQRVLHIVSAESLLNDATGLVAFKLAVVAAAATGLFDLFGGRPEVPAASGGGVATGMVFCGASALRSSGCCGIDATDPVPQTLLTISPPTLRAGHYRRRGDARVGHPRRRRRRLVGERQEIAGSVGRRRGGTRAKSGGCWPTGSTARCSCRFGLQLRVRCWLASPTTTPSTSRSMLALWVPLMAPRTALARGVGARPLPAALGWAGARTVPDPAPDVPVSWAAVGFDHPGDRAVGAGVHQRRLAVPRARPSSCLSRPRRSS